MAEEQFFQNEILTNFLYPFLLIFLIGFAVLEKSKLLGENKKQLNALVALVLGLIFIAAFRPKIIVGNLVLFLGVALVVIFIIMLLWGFVFTTKEKGLLEENWIRIGLSVVIGGAVIGAIVWATGISDFVLKQKWASNLWVNIPFIIIVAVILAFILIPKRDSGNSGK